jgi:hypothetical protein
VNVMKRLEAISTEVTRKPHDSNAGKVAGLLFAMLRDETPFDPTSDHDRRRPRVRGGMIQGALLSATYS